MEIICNFGDLTFDLTSTGKSKTPLKFDWLATRTFKLDEKTETRKVIHIWIINAFVKYFYPASSYVYKSHQLSCDWMCSTLCRTCVSFIVYRRSPASTIVSEDWQLDFVYIWCYRFSEAPPTLLIGHWQFSLMCWSRTFDLRTRIN